MLCVTYFRTHLLQILQGKLHFVMTKMQYIVYLTCNDSIELVCNYHNAHILESWTQKV